MRKTLLISIFFLWTNDIFSQQVYGLTLSKRKLDFTGVPFNNFEILDSRFDTTTVYTYHDAHYPRKYLKLLPSTSIAFQQGLTDLISPLTKGDTTLLINIKQLRIWNKKYIIRQDAKHRYYTSEVRDYLLFIADIYYKLESDRYRKLASVDKRYFMLGIDLKKTPLLQDLIKTAAIAQQTTDTNTVSLEQISATSRDEWNRFQIMRDSNYATGVFRSFDDFKSKTVTELEFDLTTTNDSIYTISFKDNKSASYRLLPYALSQNGELFIQLFRDRYLRLQKRDATFYFTIPANLPNMYELMAIEAINSDGFWGSTTPSGNVFMDLVALALFATVDEISGNQKKKKIERHAQPNMYRQVAIDMYSGDFIY